MALASGRHTQPLPHKTRLFPAQFTPSYMETDAIRDNVTQLVALVQQRLMEHREVDAATILEHMTAAGGKIDDR